MEAYHSIEALREQGIKTPDCKDCPGPKNTFLVRAIVDLVDGTKLNAEEARYLCHRFGVLHYEYDGAFCSFRVSDITDSDSFRVVINYGYEVQLQLHNHPIFITLKQLRGKCGDIIDSEGYLVTTWYARVERLAHKSVRTVCYRMTVKRAQEIGHWVYCIAQTLVGAKREATKLWRDSFAGDLFVEDMATGEAWTRHNRSNRKWEKVK